MLDAARISGALERYRDGPAKHPRSYPDLHEHVLALARAGLLHVIEEPVNKDTEMHPLVRWQYRGGIPEAERLQQEAMYAMAADMKPEAAPSTEAAARASIAAYESVAGSPFAVTAVDTLIAALK